MLSPTTPTAPDTGAPAFAAGAGALAGGGGAAVGFDFDDCAWASIGAMIRAESQRDCISNSISRTYPPPPNKRMMREARFGVV